MRRKKSTLSLVDAPPTKNADEKRMHLSLNDLYRYQVVVFRALLGSQGLGLKGVK